MVKNILKPLKKNAHSSCSDCFGDVVLGFLIFSDITGSECLNDEKRTCAKTGNQDNRRTLDDKQGLNLADTMLEGVKLQWTPFFFFPSSLILREIKDYISGGTVTLVRDSSLKKWLGFQRTLCFSFCFVSFFFHQVRWTHIEKNSKRNQKQHSRLQRLE